MLFNGNGALHVCDSPWPMARPRLDRSIDLPQRFSSLAENLVALAETLSALYARNSDDRRRLRNEPEVVLND